MPAGVTKFSSKIKPVYKDGAGGRTDGRWTSKSYHPLQTAQVLTQATSIGVVSTQVGAIGYISTGDGASLSTFASRMPYPATAKTPARKMLSKFSRNSINPSSSIQTARKANTG